MEQDTLGFNAPYSGPNSLSPNRGAETTDATLYLGARLWQGAEAWLNGEVDQGFGLDDTLGAAGFPSGEAYKVGKNQPYLRLPRLFIRQTLNLGEPGEAVAAAPNQLAGSRSADRLVITIGKFSVGDIFDVNRYAHDPRADFFNWAAIDAGTFDYAADAWGYTAGAAVEWYRGAWTLRGGLFDLSDVPNSARLEPGFHEFQSIVELERRYEIADRARPLRRHRLRKPRAHGPSGRRRAARRRHGHSGEHRRRAQLPQPRRGQSQSGTAVGARPRRLCAAGESGRQCGNL